MMKTHLSHIMPVGRACEILGSETVYRIGRSLVRLKESASTTSTGGTSNNNASSVNQSMTTALTTTTASDDDIRFLCSALCYQADKPSSTAGSEQNLGGTGGTGGMHSLLEDYNLTNSFPGGSSTSGGSGPDVKIQQAWKKWLTHPQLVIDTKAMFIQFAVPSTVQPHPGPTGHMGLFDCWVYALQGPTASNANPANTISNNSYYYSGSSSSTTASTNSSGTSAVPTIWLPDVLILFAITKEYCDFRIRQKERIVQYRKWKQQEQAKLPSSADVNTDRWDSTSMLEPSPAINDYEASLKLSPADRKIIWTMATLSYRIYDSYQKKGIVQRETLHRFLTDVYGEDSYKQPKNKALLDVIFYVPKTPTTPASGGIDSSPINSLNNNHVNNNSYLLATVSEQQFCKRVLDTVRIDDIHTTHLLLDWIATLGCCMNVSSPHLPKTVASYLDYLNRHNLETKKPICRIYNLAECRLYEIKRRFHSMVAKSASNISLIEGHPITTTTDGAAGVSVNTSPVSGTVPPPTSDASNVTAETGTANILPATTGSNNKYISCSYFVQALSSSNEELGTGGYLPPELAKLVCQAGCISSSMSNDTCLDGSSNNLSNLGNCDASLDRLMTIDNTLDEGHSRHDVTFMHGGWGLYNVLQFGCMAVRHDTTTPEDPDLPLLRFLFRIFQISAHSNIARHVDDSRILSRPQVTKMLQLLADYAVFRRRADCPPIDLEDDDEIYDNSNNGNDIFCQNKHIDERTNLNELVDNIHVDDSDSYENNTNVDLTACTLLGLIPPDYVPPMYGGRSPTKANSPTVPLKVLVDYTLNAYTATKDQMTFDEFLLWHSSKMTETGPRTRLGPLMTELRLIAAVQFGIPPVLASMEITLIAEIERRHKLRYPQTDTNRRGPRGTVWYFIDALWFSSWANLVKKTAGTPIDNQDGRGVMHQSDRSRTLNRIRNTGLLVDDGSLAIRADVRWKRDYEILPPLAWSALQAWYDGGPPIYRSVVKYVNTMNPGSPHSSKLTNPSAMLPIENEIELYPLFVTVYLCDAANRGEARPFQQNFQLSRVSPILVMLVQLCKELGVNLDQARLWVIGKKASAASASGLVKAYTESVFDGSEGTTGGSTNSPTKIGGGFSHTDDWILSLDQNIVEQMKRRGVSSMISKDSMIALLLELKDRDTGLWPRGTDGKDWMFRNERSCSTTASPTIQHPPDLGDGIVGLYNMGNTCYLNSSIQCLSHTPIFREYFTSKAYLNDINTTNPLGHEGKLAQVTAMLINSLWRRFSSQVKDPTQHHKRVTAPGSFALVTAPALTPKTFKDSLSLFNEHFQGNEQHDAQEMLAFLLGGLSEDLNRIVDKPYIEAPDSDGRPDSELADIWWSNHLKREMSIIVALFTGQYKSLLTCRTCKYESARFEPFSFLQVPLPEDDSLTVTLVLYPLKQYSYAIKYCVRVRISGQLRDVLMELAKVLHNDEMDEKVADPSTTTTTSNVAGTAQSSSVSDENSIASSDAPTSTESIYLQRALNLAVVDMRDGYISKIAPNTWLLQDLQNKETGELPLLHVFELEPLPESKEKSDVVTSTVETVMLSGGTVNGEESKVPEPTANKPKEAYLAIAQRRSEVMCSNYLHPFVHRVFGTPMLLRVHDLDNCTGRQLYDIVAKRLKNVVFRPIHRFLNPLHSLKGEAPNLASDFNDTFVGLTQLDDENKAFQNVSSSVFRTTTDAEEVSAGVFPRYGFRLRITTRDGRRCPSCPWYECCIGCYVPDDDKPTVVMDGDSAVVDWHFAVDVATSGFGLQTTSTNEFGQPSNLSRPLRSTATVTIKNHGSCGTGVNKNNGLLQPGAVTLEECLDAFAKEEKIPEAYCSKCKDFRVQTKRMSLWRLPPIMIIHLKRFQFTQHMRRKLRDLVVFPIEGLDLTRIMAPSSVSTGALSKKTTTSFPGNLNESDITSSNGEDGEDGEGSDSSTGKGTREISDDGRSEMLYDLYGVVHHQGALSGGHYVASLKSEVDGQFRLFNDAQIYEIHARDVVDASAYILFYIRRDAAKAKLSDFWKVRESGSSHNSMREEDMDQLLRGRNDRCVIS